MLPAVELVTTCYEAMRKHIRPPVTVENLPFNHEAISPARLTAVLCSRHPDVRVVSFQLDAADNVPSNRRRIVIDSNSAGNQAGLPRRVFFKASHSLSIRITLHLSDPEATQRVGLMIQTRIALVQREAGEIPTPHAAQGRLGSLIRCGDALIASNRGIPNGPSRLDTRAAGCLAIGDARREWQSHDPGQTGPSRN